MSEQKWAVEYLVNDVYVDTIMANILAERAFRLLPPVHTVRLPPVQGPKRYECVCDCGHVHYEYD